jgi:hypothetical protein
MHANRHYSLQAAKGTLDQAFGRSLGIRSRSAIKIACDEMVCVYSSSLEASTPAKAGISETTITIWSRAPNPTGLSHRFKHLMRCIVRARPSCCGRGYQRQEGPTKGPLK